MSDFNRGYSGDIVTGGNTAVDAGLRRFMLGVYNKMGMGLILSAALAFLTGSFPPVRDLMFVQVGPRVTFTILGWIVALAPLGILLFGMRAAATNPRNASIVYWSVVALLGASMGTLVLRYTGASIALTFLITAVSFGGLSLVGYTTKRDLTGMGNFLIMGLFGIIIASLVNIFLQMPAIYWIVNILGVLIFAGLTAYDTQKLKMTYYELGGNEAALGVATSFGALNLYLDFINLFQFLLALFGGRRD